MLFKGFGLGLFIVLAAVLMLGAADYETFLRQHYNNPRSNVRGQYCKKMMQSRRMTRPTCKEVNTFIHDTINKITAVCEDGGEATERNLRRSKEQFRVTICTLRGSSTRYPCDYRENTSPRFIVIGCEEGLPTHYQEGQI